jgi:Fibronectin type III domain
MKAKINPVGGCTNPFIPAIPGQNLSFKNNMIAEASTNNVGPGAFNAWGEIGGLVSGNTGLLPTSHPQASDNGVPLCGEYSNTWGGPYYCPASGGSYGAALVDTAPAQESQEGANCTFQPNTDVTCTETVGTLTSTGDALLTHADVGHRVSFSVDDRAANGSVLCDVSGPEYVAANPVITSTTVTFGLAKSTGVAYQTPSTCPLAPGPINVVVSGAWLGPEGGGFEASGNTVYSPTSPALVVTGAGGSGLASTEGDVQCQNSDAAGPTITPSANCPFPVTPIQPSAAQLPDVPELTNGPIVFAGPAARLTTAAGQPESSAMAHAAASPTAAPPASPTPQELSCTVSSQVQFNPPLSYRSSATSEMALVHVILTGCKNAKNAPVSGVGNGILELPLASSSCSAAIPNTIAPTSLAVSWSSSSLGTSQMIFSGFTRDTGSDVGFDLGGTSANPVLKLTSTLTNTAFTAHYNTTPGVPSLQGTSGSVSGIPVGSVAVSVPTAPTAVEAGRGTGQQVNVHWTAPTSNGGETISKYTVTASPGGAQCSTTATPPPTTCTYKSGLAVGTPYTFTVTATNAVGDSAPSAPSNTVVPATLPTAPTGVTAHAGDGMAVIYAWNAPLSDGGLPITGYTVTSTPGNKTCTTTRTISCTITGLSNGTSYTFAVTATNAVGTSPPSAPSAAVTPGSVTIASVAFGGTRATPTITVSGSGFGSADAVLGTANVASQTQSCAPATGDDYGHNFYINDGTAGWVAGLGPPALAAVGVSISSYSNSQVVFTPGSCYGRNGWLFNSGDNYTMNMLGTTHSGTY